MFRVPELLVCKRIVTAHGLQISETEKVLETKRQNATIRVPQPHSKNRLKRDARFPVVMTRGTFAPESPATTRLVMPESRPHRNRNGEWSSVTKTPWQERYANALCALLSPIEPQSGNHVLTTSFPEYHQALRLPSLQLGWLQSRGLLYSSVLPRKASRLDLRPSDGKTPVGAVILSSSEERLTTTLGDIGRGHHVGPFRAQYLSHRFLELDRRHQGRSR